VSQGAFLAPRWSFSCAAGIAVVLAVVSVAVAQTKLVEPMVFELPFESIRMAGAGWESLAPVAPVALSRQEPEPAPRRSPARELARPSTVADPVAVQSASQEPGPQSQPAPPAATTAAEPQAAEAQNDRVVETAPVALPAAPPAQSTATGDRERSPWAQAADGSTALGKKSKDAGLATAGFFSKFGRRVAGSF
jgi:hypothetical protein